MRIPRRFRNRSTSTTPTTLKWQTAGKAGLALKPVREDREKGRFLGLVGFEPVTRSGLHQHLGVATSFILDGGLTDYQGAIELHEAGINLKGATHDAVAYQRSLMVSRLEAPVDLSARDRARLRAAHRPALRRDPQSRIRNCRPTSTSRWTGCRRCRRRSPA